MVWIEGGEFRMGSDAHYPEEAPAHCVRVNGFFIDPCPVTNRQFAAFVAATGYRTVGERIPNPADYPGALPHILKPGSLVFRKTRGPVDLRDISNWWEWKPGAYWRHPEDKGSSVAARLDHPVVQIALEDAEAYALWAGKALPTEAEWEFAARGGLDSAEFVWGDEFAPKAARWQTPGRANSLGKTSCVDGFERTSPVGVFPANGYGLFDMAGNVWAWATDWFSARHLSNTESPCCVPSNPRGAPVEASLDAAQLQSSIPHKVVKGGSFLCAPNYCCRYRPAARHAQPIDTGMSHVGFRCVVRT